MSLQRVRTIDGLEGGSANIQRSTGRRCWTGAGSTSLNEIVIKNIGFSPQLPVLIELEICAEIMQVKYVRVELPSSSYRAKITGKSVLTFEAMNAVLILPDSGNVVARVTAPGA